MKILVVEEDAAFARLCREKLIPLTDDVIVASDATEALSLIETSRFDLMILQLSVSGTMSGEDLIGRLDDRGIELPVVALTDGPVSGQTRAVRTGRVVFSQARSGAVCEALPGIVRAALEVEALREGREAEVRARTLFEESLAGMFVVEVLTGTIVEANRVGAESFGYTPEAIRGKEFAGLFIDAERPVVRAKIANADDRAAAGRSIGLRADGSRFSFGYRASSISAAGRPAVLVSGRDLSEAQSAELRYREFFQNAFEAVMITDQNTHEIIDCNPACERLLGRGLEELRALSAWELFGLSGSAKIVELGQRLRALELGTHADFETQARGHDGRSMCLAVRSGPFLLGGRRVLLSFIRDLTGERAAEERHRQIFLKGFDPIAIFDRETGLLVDANPVFETLSGYGLTELMSSPSASLIVNEQGERMMVRAAEGNDAHAVDRSVSLVTKSGESIPVCVRVSELTLGEKSMTMLTLRDLRPELRAAELERSLTHAQKMQSLGQMASGVAHDFNNTLMAALPWADLLRRKYPKDEAVQRSAEHIRKAVHRARDVTRQLLEFAQPKKPVMTELNVAAFIDEQLKMIRPAVPREIEIEFRQRDETVRANADAGQLSQIILNLSLNARDAMPAGGVLSFEVRALTRTEAERWGLSARPWGVIVVADNGVGIRDELVDKIFDPFFTTRELGQGTGLGLSVVHRLAREHGGEVFVCSEEGKGSTFYLVLPQAGARQWDPAVQMSGRMSGQSVLIVDDEPVVAEGLASLLETEGARTRSEATGPAALELLRGGFSPSFIILDIGLPEMSGEMVHREIRSIHPEVPILISSGYVERERILPLLADPFTRFIQKPFDVEDLLEEFQSLTLPRIAAT